MSLHLSPTCLPHFVSHSGFLGSLHVSPTLVSQPGCLGPHEFTLVSPLSPTLGALGRVNLYLSPTPVSHTCLPLWVPWAALSPTLGALGRTSLHLSPPCLPLVSHTCLLGSLGRMSLHLSPPCLPHLSLSLGALGRMSLHLSPPCLPNLRAYGRMSLQLSPPCLPHLSPTPGALGRMSLQLLPTCPQLVSHTCLPLWIPWAA